MAENVIYGLFYDVMGEACMGEIRGGNMLSVSKPYNKRALGRLGRRWKEDLTIGNVRVT